MRFRVREAIVLLLALICSPSVFAELFKTDSQWENDFWRLATTYVAVAEICSNFKQATEIANRAVKIVYERHPLAEWSPLMEDMLLRADSLRKAQIAGLSDNQLQARFCADQPAILFGYERLERTFLSAIKDNKDKKRF